MSEEESMANKAEESERLVRLVDDMIDAFGKGRGGQAFAAKALGVTSQFISRHRTGSLEGVSHHMAEKIRLRTGVCESYFRDSFCSGWQDHVAAINSRHPDDIAREKFAVLFMSVRPYESRGKVASRMLETADNAVVRTRLEVA